MEERGVLLHNFTIDGDRISVFERHQLTPRDQGGGKVPDRHRRQELKRHAAAEAAGMYLKVSTLSMLQSCLTPHAQPHMPFGGPTTCIGRHAGEPQHNCQLGVWLVWLCLLPAKPFNKCHVSQQPAE